VPHLSVSLLGPFQVRLDGEPVTSFETLKARALLAYLADDPGRAYSRSSLASLLWPERSQRAALSNLRHTLAVLRAALHDPSACPPFLLIDRETIAFNPHSDCTLDTLDFRRLVEASSSNHPPGDQNLNCLEQAVALYRGDFLEAFGLDDSAEYEAWLLLRREHYRTLALDALQRLAEAALLAADYEQAKAYARRAIALEPWREAAHCQLMRALALQGRRAEAFAQLAACRETLERELGVEPSPATLQLAEEMRGGRLAEAPAPPLFLRQIESRASPPPLFVAREAELDRLEAALQLALSGKGQVVFITGGPGCGKTALAGAFIRRAQQIHPALLAVQGSCQAYFGQGDPYLPFREILEMLTGAVEERWAAGLIEREQALRLWQAAPQAIQALVEAGPALVGRLLSGEALLARATAASNILFSHPEGPAWLKRLGELVERRRRAPPGEGAAQDDLFYQYGRALRTLSRRAPLLLFLDDLQWADSGSLNLLFSLARRMDGARLLVLGAYRPAEAALARGPDSATRPHSLVSLVHECQLLFGQPQVDLEQADERAFVEAFLDSQPNRLGGSFRERLFLQARGHPLFTIELLRGMQARGELIQDPSGTWQEAEALDWERLPPRVEAAIAARLERLPGALLDLLEVASVEGERFTLQVVSQVLPDDPAQLMRELSTELDRRQRLVRSEGLETHGDQRLARYRFRHILFQRYLYSRLDPLARARLHERVGLALEQLYGEDCDQVAAQLALHFEMALLPGKACEYLYRAGERAVQLSANAEALACFSHALELTPAGDRAGRFRLLLARQNVYHHTGQRQAEAQDLQELEALARGLGPAQQAQVALRRADLASATRKWSDLLAEAQSALDLAQAAGELPLQAEAYLCLSYYYQYDEMHCDMQASVEVGERALNLARQAGLKQLEAAILGILWRPIYFIEFEKSLSYAEAALQIYRSLGDRYGESGVLYAIGLYHVWEGDFCALSYFERSRQISREIGNLATEMWAFAMITIFYELYGRLPELSADLLEAIEIARQLENPELECMPMLMLSEMYRLQGDTRQAMTLDEQVLTICREQGVYYWEFIGMLHLARVQVDTGYLEQATQAFQQALPLMRAADQLSFEHIALSGLARVEMDRGNLVQALAYVEECLPLLESATQKEYLYETYWSYLTCCQVLAASRDPRTASVLERAYRRLIAEAALVPDETSRRSYLENVPWHRQILALYAQRLSQSESSENSVKKDAHQRGKRGW
jgi:adenylate cyclase